jgi:beta-glucosidase
MGRIAAALLSLVVFCSLPAMGWAQSGAPAATAPGCCGRPMDLDGLAYVYAVPNGKASDGTPVPEYLQTEVYGDELVARTTLDAGVYTVVITGSENSFSAAGKRLFDVEALSGGHGPTGDDSHRDPGVRTLLAGGVDLFKLAGGEGKPYLIKASVKHPGGSFRIVFHGQVDNAKFSSIKILDSQGVKRAWLFAEDVAEMLKQPDTPPVVPGPVIYKDAGQPLDRRVADLIRRMTLREKIGQIQNGAPAIDRLGIPAYNYWSEGLHGVARNGYATVFPQAIGMSATFDPAALRAVGDVIATEARAKYNAWQLQGGLDIYGGYYRGLTFWSPNINLFRDPRWGRGQETYGEDPFLTGTMAVQFIQGLQGDNPKYFKVVATAKHFAVHSGPEPLRHTFNAAPPIRDFYESYLPHFERAVREGKVYSVMGAYNRVYGTPACDSELLLKNILRRDWGFQGYVVSDCGAISDIWSYHKTEVDRSAAAAAAVLAGCDLECGFDYRALALAVDTNLIGEGAIDRALGRVLASRFKLGLFDPSEQVPFNAIRPGENDTPAHQALALKMARESIVLLKNDGILPLSQTARKIAVVGPNADGLLPLLGNYNGTPSAPVTVLRGIQDRYRGQIVYVRGCDNATREGTWQIVPDVCLRPAGARDPDETGLRAEHFAKEDLTGQPVTVRTEKAVDLRGLIEWTIAGVPIATSSSRWSGEFVAPADGEYHLAVVGSTAFRLSVKGQSISDEWGGASQTAPDSATETAPNTQPDTAPDTQPGAAAGIGEAVLKLKAGEAVPVVLECHQAGGLLDLQLIWNRGDLDVSGLAAQRVKDADVIVYVGGLDGHMEAEENDIRGLFVGFDRGDRTAIELPACQEQMIRALSATGKPVVVVNLTGSAAAMPWEAQHVPAIVQAWYPGQAGGTALADVLFGNYNPSGKLPVTFYKATEDLPPFADYAMKGHTYRYFAGAPLWPFGHGLSYTTFRYGPMSVDKPQAGAGETVTVRVDVTNTGSRAGEEVVQIYAKPAQPGPGDALQRLVGFSRVALAAGQTVRVDVAVPVALLRNWDVEKQTYVVPAGTWTLMAGSSSADVRAMREITVK